MLQTILEISWTIEFYFEFWMSTVNKVGAACFHGCPPKLPSGDSFVSLCVMYLKEHNANNSLIDSIDESFSACVGYVKGPMLPLLQFFIWFCYSTIRSPIITFFFLGPSHPLILLVAVCNDVYNIIM